MLRLRRPSERSLRALLSAAEQAGLTYPEVGATQAEQMPGGYRHDRYEAPLGEGADVFGRAAAALFAWQAQAGAGVEVFPSGSQVADGATVVLLLRAGLWAPAPCRVVYVIDEPNRSGFAYGTLPGHPECGEAAFVLVRGADERVAFVVRSFSRRVDTLARLGAPLARLAQTRVTRRYIEALAEAAQVAMIEEAGTIYYDDSIESVVKYRRDPRPSGLMQFRSDSSGWTPLYNSITGLRLRVRDGMIEVRGMGPFRRLGKWLGFELSLAPDETTMMTIPLSRVVIGPWAVPRPKADYIALQRQTSDDSYYTLALRPSDGNFDRLRDALRMAGVTES